VDGLGFNSQNLLKQFMFLIYYERYTGHNLRHDDGKICKFLLVT